MFDEGDFMKNIIINYWLNFFPEFTYQEMEQELKKLGGDNFIEILEKEYSKYASFNSNKILDYISLESKVISKDLRDQLSERYLFSEYIFPFIEKQFDEFSRDFQGVEKFVERDYFLFNVLDCIFDRVNNFIYKTIIHYVSQLKKNNRLFGSNSKERMTYFCKIFPKNKENILSFYGEFSELTILVFEVIKNNFDYIIEILTNYHKSISKILTNFNLTADTKIRKIEVGSGDTHRKGKSVGIIYLSNNLKIVYKPRTMEILEL